MLRDAIREALAHPGEFLAEFATLVLIYGAVLAIGIVAAAVAQP